MKIKNGLLVLVWMFILILNGLQTLSMQEDVEVIYDNTPLDSMPSNGIRIFAIVFFLIVILIILGLFTANYMMNFIVQTAITILP